MTIGDGKVVMANPDDKGQAELVADTDGEVKVRLDGQYLAEALRACGGMVELKLTNAYSPTLFTANGYQLVVMPMLTNEANNQAKADREAKGEATTTEQAEPETYAVKGISGGVPKAVTPTEPVAEKPKAKRSRAKEPVTA